MTSINGETQLIGFFGATYKTSKMYAMYNAAFEALGLNYVYVPLVVQDLEKAVEGVRHLGIKAIGVTMPYKIDVVPYLDELDRDARRIGAVNAIVINATSVGMVPTENESLVKNAFLSPESVVMDLVSRPKETKLLKEAQERGCKIVYGDRMLFWQGVLKFKVYTGLEPPIEVMEQALNTL